MYKTTAKIDGMACSMCEAHVNETVRRAFPVKKVTSLQSQVSATEESKKISAGDFQPKHFLGRELIKSTTF